jgi:hypothetical protein
MGVRPPGNDGTEEEEAVTFGIAALDARFDDTDLTFPASEGEVIDALGDPRIEYDPQGNTVALSTALSEVEAERFERRRDLMNALHPAFERRRQSGGGVLGWVRSVMGR